MSLTIRLTSTRAANLGVITGHTHSIWVTLIRSQQAGVGSLPYKIGLHALIATLLSSLQSAPLTAPHIFTSHIPTTATTITTITPHVFPFILLAPTYYLISLLLYSYTDSTLSIATTPKTPHIYREGCGAWKLDNTNFKFNVFLGYHWPSMILEKPSRPMARVLLSICDMLNITWGSPHPLFSNA